MKIIYLIRNYFNRHLPVAHQRTTERYGEIGTWTINKGYTVSSKVRNELGEFSKVS
jgi:hypothetical protein|tara:strand:+ start:2217 stop:2384 length:168 start_codon:yes stop_codon:yes gene_type:complete